MAQFNKPIWSAVIPGELASKSNSRQLVTIKGKPRFIKSAKARGWTDFAVVFLKRLRPAAPFDRPLILTAIIRYADYRSDLTDELLCDALQKADIIKNDRLIHEKHIYHAIDKLKPRTEVSLAYRGDVA